MLIRDHDGEAANRRHRLRELIVQLARDHASFFIQSLLDELIELATLLQTLFRFHGLAIAELFSSSDTAMRLKVEPIMSAS